MYAWLESHPIAHSDSDILSLTWKGSVPLSEKEKQYIRKRSCVTGWLAVGTKKCVVGVTFSSIHTSKEYNYPLRTNFNLRGHNAEVVLVRWNEPFQKMATCDANGVIFVWIRFEKRWSIELVNDRQHQVTDFAWSHDGRMALIAYKDGFVLVGSVQGQRYWSSQLTLQPHGSTITCGAWTADDKTVLFGTNSGQIVAMDIHGAVLTQVGLSDRSKPIQYMCYNCEKFRMTFVAETIDGENRIQASGAATATSSAAAATSNSSSSASSNANSAANGSLSSSNNTRGSSAYNDCSKRNRSSRNKNLMMAVQVGNREICFMRSYDDIPGNSTDTHMTDLKMEWSTCGSLLAVGGWCVNDKFPKVKFYSLNGIVRFTLNIPSKRLISALTWAHNDKRLFVASGAGVFVALVEKHLSSLQQLARNAIVESLHPSNEDDILESVGLSPHLRKFVSHALQPTITPCFPKGMDLMKFVSTPPPLHKDAHSGEEKATRYFCTMIVYEDERGRQSASEKYGGPFVLYREYLGGLVPLLRGDKISKVRPEFEVYNPQEDLNVFDSPSSATCGCFLCHDTGSNNAYCCDAVPGGFPRQKSGVSLMSHDSRRCVSEILGDEGNDSMGAAGVGGGAVSEREKDEYFSPLSGDEADRDESGSSQSRRKKKKKTKGQFRTPVEKVSTRCRDVPFPDKLPKKETLIEVLANFWGTKFRLHGIHPNLPTDVGYVSYKTSVLHLQPRQMTIAIPLLDGSAKNTKSTSLGTVVFPGWNALLTSQTTPTSVKDNEKNKKTGAKSPSCASAEVEDADKGSKQQALKWTPNLSAAPGVKATQSGDSADGVTLPNTTSSLYTLQYHFLAHQKQQLQLKANSAQKHSSMAPLEIASDEEIMEQKVIQAVSSVKSGKPLEVAAAVASVLTNRSDDPVVSPMQRCPKHPPQSRIPDNPAGESTAQFPSQDPNDLRMFSNVFNPQFPSHFSLAAGHQCSSFAHVHNRHVMNPQPLFSSCQKPNFNKPGHSVSGNVAFMQREEMCCRPRPQFSVRPKSCFAGGGVHHRSCSSGASTSANMFLSLPPVQPPLLASKPGMLNSSSKTLSFCRSDDESAESGPEVQGASEKTAVKLGPNGSKESRIPVSGAVLPSNQANHIGSMFCVGDASRSDVVCTAGKAFDGDSSGLCLRQGDQNQALNFVSNDSPASSSNFFLSPHNLFPCMQQHAACDNSSQVYKSVPYHRTRSCPPVNQIVNFDKNLQHAASFQTNQQTNTGNSGMCGIHSAPANHTMSCRQEATVRSKLGLISLAPPAAAAFGGSPDRNHSRAASWSLNSNSAPNQRKHSPSGRAPNASSGSQYNLCNNKSSVNVGDTSDSECYLSGDEAGGAAATITNPELRRRQMRKFRKLPRKPENLPKRSEKEEFVMLNKSPIWNESTQVYQLDFGGRVTQESAKNFQIEHNKEQVLQFGRIDDNAYTLDFQTPFSALQAFGIALANVTQRLK